MATNPEPSETVFAQMFAVAFDPEVVGCTNAIRQLGDFDIPQSRAAAFLRFHAFITDPQPSYINAWRANKPRSGNGITRTSTEYSAT